MKIKLDDYNIMLNKEVVGEDTFYTLKVVATSELLEEELRNGVLTLVERDLVTFLKALDKVHETDS